MLRTISSYVIFLFLLGIFDASAQHRALLPRPQRAVYGSASLSTKNLTIQLLSNAAPEDRYAAERLSSCLVPKNSLKIVAESGPPSSPTITLNRTGPVDALPQPGEKPGPDSREAYSMVITKRGGEIKAKSSAGIFYGVQTLCQLVEADGTIPEVKIEDWPALAYRGVLVDMSEGPLPTKEEVERQIDFLSRWKVNQYYFYSESSIELAGYPLLNPEARFSKNQIRRIVAYARQRHIDVVPSLELYGHLHDLFRIEKYSAMADFPHGGEFNPRDPRVMKLVANWADQFCELFPSPFVNIGFDETWEIQKAAQSQGKGTTAVDLFIEQLGNVSKLFEQHGKTVMAWADIMVKYPGIVAKLPPGTIALPWYYDPNPDPEYKRWLGPLVEHRIPLMVTTGINSWDEIYPDYNLTFANIDTFLAAGKKANALGTINTIWTDDNQMLMRLSWPGLAYGAAAAWQTTPVDRTDFFSDYASQMYAPQVATEVSTALAKLTASETLLQQAIGHGTMDELWSDPFDLSILKRSEEHKDDLRQSRILAEEAQEHLYRAAEFSKHPDQLSELLFTGRLLDYAGMKFLYSTEIKQEWQALGRHPSPERLNDEFISDVASEMHGKLADLMDGITGLQPQYRAAWLAQYTPYRMETALGRWNAEYELWRKMQTRLQSFSASYHGASPLPTFQSIVGSD
ncbi:MAG: family 20 glycosylhydrolase [Acidobacteriaceae bacterium]